MKNKIFGFFLAFILFYSRSYATVSDAFYPNLNLSDSVAQMNEVFSKMDSDAGLGIYGNGYIQLGDKFSTIFSYMPNQAKFTTIKNNCSTLLAKNDTSRLGYTTFKSKCSDPLKAAISEMNSTYTVRASGKIMPSEGPAPLNVTLNATTSVDPSNQTIPDAGYFWYYRDTQGVDREIGVGPTINYSFQNEGNYVVHLTVRSSNKSQGILDGSASFNVKVGAKVADIVVYGNEKLLTTQGFNKFNIIEGQNGIRLNGAGTQPTAGRKILSHKWVVTDSNNGTIFSSAFDGAPTAVDIKFSQIGTYKVTLYVTDNLNNTISQTYQLVFSDPVTIIKSSPENVTTSQTKNFDGSYSYTVRNKIESYKWELYDPAGKKETISGKNFQRQFKVPGSYKAVLLTTNSNGDQGRDELNFDVLSTPPVAAFNITPVRKWAKPSQFILDAGDSYDYDIQNGVDSLTYSWDIVDSSKAGVFIDPVDGGKKVTVQFNEKGKHTLRLTVTDKYGQTSTKLSTITVDSVLRPELVDMPKVMTIGESRTIKVQSNLNAVAYVWNIAGVPGTITQDTTKTISYNKVGAYNVSVTAQTADDSNTVSNTIFVAEKDSPTLAYDVVKSDGTIMSQDSAACSGADNTNGYSYVINRNEYFTIDTSASINSRGGTDGMGFIYTPKNSTNIEQVGNLRYKFDELGCQSIKITQSETGSPKTNEVTLYFNVKNALPKIGNISISFPQYGDATGIGFNATNTKPLCGPDGYDPILVRVSAINARDDDGTIVRYKWYYFDEDMPNEYKEVKVTPGSLPYAVFSLPQDGKHYSFAVKVEDNDGGITDSQDVVGKSGSFFCPSDTTETDKPTNVSLVASNDFVKVGEEVTFKAKSDVLSERSDYNTTRVYKYDLDGDGTYDFITKADTVKWIYSKGGKYTPTVLVSYRGYSTTASASQIEVQKGLVANFLVATIGNNVLVKDMSYGDIEARTFCMDAQQCDDTNFIVKDKGYFVYPYSSGGNHIIRLDVVDKYGNKETKVQKVSISSTTSSSADPKLVTLPAYQKNNSGINTIDIGSSMNNEVLFYPSGNGCYVDTDLSVDSNKDGNPKNDPDIKCGSVAKVKYSPSVDNISFGFFDGKLLQEMKINFLDFDQTVSSENRQNYTNVRNLVGEIQQNSSSDERVANLVDILNKLKDNIEDKNQTAANLATLKEFLKNNPDIDLPQDVLTRVQGVVDSMSSGAVDAIDTSAGTGTDMDNLKTDLFNVMPNDTQTALQKDFDSFNNANGNKDEMKAALSDIVKIVQKSQSEKKITDAQASNLQTKICNIVSQSSIPVSGGYCGSGPVDTTISTGAVVSSSSSKSGVLSGVGGSIWKIIATILGVLALAFIGLVLFFALKAKRQQTGATNKKTGTGTKTSAPAASQEQALKFPDAPKTESKTTEVKTETKSTTSSSEKK